ncbi:MAG: YkgJ family cysteine cluster protein [Planctomycetota bacterium]|jgi:Fe-S-cluster containining protein
MRESQSATLLENHNQPQSASECGTETFSLELDILGKPVHACISVAPGQARLSDIVPLARALSSKFTLAMLESLRAAGKSVPCRKGCLACCSYLVPVSVPEAFRLVEELSAMPSEKGRTLLQSSLEAASRILAKMPRNLGKDQLVPTKTGNRSNQLDTWYAGLRLRCPFLSDKLCVTYDQRPIACREHAVTGAAGSCDVEGADEPDVVKMPVSVLECLGRLAAELEQSDLDAIMLPLALPWVEENIERSNRTWSAVAMVERFIEIIQEKAKVQI